MPSERQRMRSRRRVVFPPPGGESSSVERKRPSRKRPGASDGGGGKIPEPRGLPLLQDGAAAEPHPASAPDAEVTLAQGFRRRVAGEIRGDIAKALQVLLLHGDGEGDFPFRQQYRHGPSHPEPQLLRQGLPLLRQRHGLPPQPQRQYRRRVLIAPLIHVHSSLSGERLSPCVLLHPMYPLSPLCRFSGHQFPAVA